MVIRDLATRTGSEFFFRTFRSVTLLRHVVETSSEDRHFGQPVLCDVHLQHVSNRNQGVRTTCVVVPPTPDVSCGRQSAELLCRWSLHRCLPA